MREKTAIVLLNMGGPESLRAVRPFLFNLFSDREIITLGPEPLQKPLAWLISMLRAPKTRRAYKLIGGGSPLVKITQQQAGALKKALEEEGYIMDVFVGMRYWHPFIHDAVEKAKDKGYQKVMGLSLYPQYSKATTGSSLNAFRKVCDKLGLKYIEVVQWFDNPLYIKALADTTRKALSPHPKEETCLLFSAHGLPVKFIEEGDPYQDQIEETVRLVCDFLKNEDVLPEHIRIAYQSRTGPMKWIEPYTDEAIRECADKGLKRVVIVPVSFVSDHIETLYEIDILYKQMATERGIQLYRAESLNISPLFIESLKDVVLKHLL